jgi:hypothetical protein
MEKPVKALNDTTALNAYKLSPKPLTLYIIDDKFNPKQCVLFYRLMQKEVV